jgi:hypothetical protein
MTRFWRQTALLHTGARRCLAIALGCLMATGLSAAHPRDFDVRGGELRPALDAYIAQSGVQLIYKVEDVKDLSTRGVKGRIAPDAALDRLLDGTRLRIRRGPDGAMVVIAPTTGRPVAGPGSADRKP